MVCNRWKISQKSDRPLFTVVKVDVHTNNHSLSLLWKFLVFIWCYFLVIKEDSIFGYETTEKGVGSTSIMKD